ncbi:MAG TPA: class II aldolase/adducin family protein [Bacteroidia bacterium]|jgi:L-ribulose-5-phosphate 4-epimerase|nr:class II aldolase/adducin family protein [Bacteroidia bacterium]
MIDEGYIKFICNWQQTKIPALENMNDLLEARNLLFQKKLIGYDTFHKVGYGNISKRTFEDQFLISGTQTGHIENLDINGYSYAESFDIEKNTVNCIGPVKASSESMTHAAIYLLDKKINAVVHVHHKSLWESLLKKLPAAKKEISYGTPAMANEVSRLAKEENLLENKIFAMAGHDDGVISFGSNMQEAMNITLFHFTAL